MGIPAVNISTKVFSGFGIVLLLLLSGRVERIFEKGAWSHEQLVGLVRKLAKGRDGVA